jgi:acyl-CoA synthetase (AMP-forming)/AMP-acid ligase II
MPSSVVERALTLLPDVNLVNAYGLTETSSTISLLGPEHHRAAFASGNPVVRARLGSVGQPLPGVEISIRDPDGRAFDAGERGEIWVRGEQVSGEYVGRSTVDDEGWFRTRDAGHLDADGFLYVHGRLDDVIVRGGENLSPGEIEEVLVAHPAVDSAAVVGIPDREWGERVVASVVLVSGASVTEDELRQHVRNELRSARTPERIKFADELPFNQSGKLLRRVLRDELAAELASEEDPNG